MNKKTQLALATMAGAAVATNLSSCKYEDGPKLTLKSKTSRLTGNWSASIIDGDTVSTFGDNTSVNLDFDKDGVVKFDAKFSYTYYGYTYNYAYSETGTWTWEDKKATVQMIMDGDTTDLKVTRLTNKELQGTSGPDNDRWELTKE